MNKTVDSRTENRKEEHLKIALNNDVGFKLVSGGFERYRFVHKALPESDLSRIDISTSLFGKYLAAPILISSMVGGNDASRRVNRNLARAAQALGIAMGVGSQRCAIEDAGTTRTFQVRDVAPDILLFANLGAVQLNYGYGVDECQKAVEMIGADGLILHVNPLQEALQPEGNTDFTNLIQKIEKICRSLTVPVIVKEVSWGISEQVARMLADAGVSGIDTAGAGGTCWSEVEKRRTGTANKQRIAEAFASWGIPTAESVIMARRGAPGVALIASGGVRDGVEAAKAIALGANAVGVAMPFLKAASDSDEAVVGAVEEIMETLRIAMFCIGATNTEELHATTALYRQGE